MLSDLVTVRTDTNLFKVSESTQKVPGFPFAALEKRLWRGTVSVMDPGISSIIKSWGFVWVQTWRGGEVFVFQHFGGMYGRFGISCECL